MAGHRLVRTTHEDERLLPVGAPTWLDAGRYARIMTAGLRLLARLPGIK